MPMLEVENLVTFYGEFQALRGVSLTVDEKRLVGVVGANGAGKTTLLRTITGLTPAQSGHIRFKGVSIEKLPTFRIAKLGIALVPEGRRLFPYMTVYENLLLGAFLRPENDERDKRLKSIFDFFPILKDRSSQLAGTLSGGEQQMLAIGRSLMAQPKLLLLDEPLLGLSPAIQYLLAKAIKEIRDQRGTSIIVSEQYARPIMPIIDFGYILENGASVVEGTTQELMDNPDVKSAYFGS